MKYAPISLRYIGMFGGASAQAVHKSGDARRWLDARLHRFLREGVETLDKGSVGLMWQRWKDHAQHLSLQMALAPECKSGGRPFKDSVESFAEWLGVEAKVGDTLVKVLSRYVNRKLRSLLKKLDKPLTSRQWLSILHLCWMPLWVNRRVAEVDWGGLFDPLLGGKLRAALSPP